MPSAVYHGRVLASNQTKANEDSTEYFNENVMRRSFVTTPPAPIPAKAPHCGNIQLVKPRPFLPPVCHV